MTYDYVILGAGIAGLSLADALMDHTRRILILDNKGIAAGASGTPVGMVNPATGRRGKKVWHVEQALPAIRNSLESASKFSDKKIYAHKGILRPAQDEEMAKEMHKRFRKTEWPPGWCYWLTEKEMKVFHPGIQCTDGGFWLPVGMAVDVPAYLNAIARKIISAGAEISVRPSYTYQRHKNNYWQIITDRDEKIKTKKVIWANGANVRYENLWSYLPLNEVKGQIALFEVDPPLSFSYSISSKGYLAHVDPTKIAVGSTYEHSYQTLDPDQEGLDQLRDKIQSILPKLFEKVEVKKQWAGLRIHTTDHKPVIGEHPELKNQYIFTGLGSKGLLYGRYLAESLANYLTDGNPLPAEVNIKRFK